MGRRLTEGVPTGLAPVERGLTTTTRRFAAAVSPPLFRRLRRRKSGRGSCLVVFIDFCVANARPFSPSTCAGSTPAASGWAKRFIGIAGLNSLQTWAPPGRARWGCLRSSSPKSVTLSSLQIAGRAFAAWWIVCPASGLALGSSRGSVRGGAMPGEYDASSLFHSAGVGELAPRRPSLATVPGHRSRRGTEKRHHTPRDIGEAVARSQTRAPFRRINLVFFLAGSECDLRGLGRWSGSCGAGLDGGAAMQSLWGVRSSGIKGACRIVPSEDRHRGGLGAEKRLAPGEKPRAKFQASVAQRLTMKKPQNRLEKNKPLCRLDLRRNCRAALALRASRRASGERIQTTVNKQLATRNRGLFGPEGGVEKNTSPAGRLTINGLSKRTCDARKEGRRAPRPVGDNCRTPDGAKTPCDRKMDRAYDPGATVRFG